MRIFTALICALALIFWSPEMSAGAAGQDASQQAAPDPKIPPDQLDSLVAPVALYPDPLLAQVLAAATYPLEIIQLQQWLAANPGLKDKALADAVEKQNWDPSVQGLAGLPDVVKRLSDDVKWTTDLGNAFLAQQSDVMDAVQRMRAKAQGQGNLKSSEQVKVETQTVESKQVIVIQQANPQVVYVPSYNPVVVYGPPVYPYPPIYYPPPGAYVAGMAISFGVGVAMGAMWSGGWGYNCGWHGGNNNITINNNNNFNRNTNINGGNRNNINNGNRPSQQPGRGGNSNWQHNPQHRGGTPYGNQSTAKKFGGTTGNSSLSQRQNAARQNIGQEQRGGQQFGGPGQNRGGENRGGAGAGQGAGAGNRGGAGAGQGAGAGNRAGGAGQGAGAGNRGGAAGGGDRVGNRSVPSNSGGERGGGAFGGGGGNRSSAQSSSARGASSMNRSRGGGGGGGGRRR
jgi:Protein of unknown function (DUF3300)